MNENVTCRSELILFLRHINSLEIGRFEKLFVYIVWLCLYLNVKKRTHTCLNAAVDELINARLLTQNWEE